MFRSASCKACATPTCRGATRSILSNASAPTMSNSRSSRAATIACRGSKICAVSKRRSPLSWLTPSKFGHHRAAERLLESLAQLVLGFDGVVEAAVPFGEAFCFDEALLAHPGIALHAQADDMDGERSGFARELRAEIARRAAAGLFAVGEEHDQGGLGAEIEHLGGSLHRRG